MPKSQWHHTRKRRRRIWAEEYAKEYNGQILSLNLAKNEGGRY